MIPEINGESRERVREFISASTYAMKNIQPADEAMLLETILCTKFKGKAMTDFDTRDIRDFEQLKRELETEYLGKRGMTHLQLEFNSLKQKAGESAHEFGRRVEKIARELYEAMEEGQGHSQEQQKTILDSIKTQALQNFQIGLHDDIKMLVRAQRYQSLQEAITGATAKKKIRGPSPRNGLPANRNKFNQENARNAGNATVRCYKCGKTGHYGRDCPIKFVLLYQVDINNIANDQFLRRILWTDECTFRSDGRINRHNEYHYAEENPHCRKETHIQGQFHINVWMNILDNQVIGPYFFPENINVTAEVYSAFLEEILPNLLEDVPLAVLPNIIFQQDGHPAHTSLLARNILNQRFPNRWIGIHSTLHEWPPRSPDLTPMDFFVWGYIRDQVYETLPPCRNKFIRKIETACQEITPVMLLKVRESIMRRIALCAEENSSYFEHLL
ncbi:uncharacterized protein [Temnothorax longispinosus]|uniref:uncharacterized protein n=1 Tax=Temnothorax longispinosus TaxID=300112 RepID=UPI003A9A1998